MNKIAISGYLYTDTHIRPLRLYRQSYNRPRLYSVAAIIYHAPRRASISKLPPV
jgi:hypothetical protein